MATTCLRSVAGPVLRLQKSTGRVQRENHLKSVLVPAPLLGSSSCSFASSGHATLEPARMPMPSRPLCRVTVMTADEAAPELERFRLNNLAPQPGSRRKEMRKGRGYSAGQGGSCGFGMRGQKSRSGKPTRPGFEGGQIPLYRRLPKLRGIAGGMPASKPKFVALNLRDILAKGVEEGEEVSREVLIAKGLLKPSGKRRNLPLKVLGTGEVGDVKFTLKAGAFSTGAKDKLEAAGCSMVVIPGKKKWTKKGYFKAKREAEEAAKAEVSQ